MKLVSVLAISTIILVFCIFAETPMKSPAYAGEAHDPSRFTYARLYCSADGDTHFQNITVELGKSNFAPPASPLYIGGNLPAGSTFFGGFDPGWGRDDLRNRVNHPAPAVQFLVFLQGDFSITTTDGETRQFRAGDVLRLEDVSPCKGHITVIGDEPGIVMFAR